MTQLAADMCGSSTEENNDIWMRKHDTTHMTG